jgi:tetratricopeptide (TPR) repeat protein
MDKNNKYKRKIIILLGAVFLVYLNSLFCPFIFDDFLLITDNPFIKNFRFIKYYFTTNLFEGVGEKTSFYRPLQTLFYALTYKISKLDPVNYHFLNILFHSLCAILIFLLLKEIYKEKLSFLVSLLWAIHPINSESVTYISGLADPLFLFFGLLAIYLYNRNLKIFSYISFILCLLSKETGILILPLFFLYLYTKGNLDENKKNDYIIVLSIFLIYIFLRMTFLNFGIIEPEDIFLHRFYTSFKVFLIYISILIFPLILSIERHVPYIKTFKNIDFLCGFIYFLLFLYFLWLKRKDKKILFAGILFLLNFLYHSNAIIPLNGNVREHWMYLGSIGFFIFVVDLILRIKREKLRFVIIFLIFMLYGTRTILRNNDWKDPVKFYEKSINSGFENGKIYYNLGAIYYQRNEYEKAIEFFKKAEPLLKDKKYLYVAIAGSYLNTGKTGLAIKYYNKVLQINPYDPMVLCYLATIYYNENKKPLSEILQMLKTCIEKNPFNSLPYNLIGKIFFDRKNFGDSIKFLKMAISINPNDYESHSLLGINYFQIGNKELAEKHLNIAYNLNPTNWENIQNLAYFYRITGDYQKALYFYQKALKIKPDDIYTLNNIGLCYAGLGEINKAKTIWKEILKKNPDYKPAKKNLELLGENNY